MHLFFKKIYVFLLIVLTLSGCFNHKLLLKQPNTFEFNNEQNWIIDSSSSIHIFNTDNVHNIEITDSDGYAEVMNKTKINGGEKRWVEWSTLILSSSENVSLDLYYKFHYKNGKTKNVFSRIYELNPQVEIAKFYSYIDEQVDYVEVAYRVWGKGKIVIKPITPKLTKEAPERFSEINHSVENFIGSIWNHMSSEWVFLNDSNKEWIHKLMYLNLRSNTTLKESIKNWKSIINRIDNHSFIYKTNKKNTEKQFDLKKGQLSNVKLKNDVGIIYIPSFNLYDKTNELKYSQHLQNLLIDSSQNVKCGWIIDLTDNRGGNGPAMLLGLAPLFENKKLMNYVNRNMEKISLILKSSGLTVLSQNSASEPVISINPKFHKKIQKRNIALLISKKTGSAAEQILISFLGQNNIRTFGSETAGFTTSNEVFDLPYDYKLALSTTYMADINGNIYKEPLKPDVYTKNVKDSYEQAISWLEKSCKTK